MTIEITEADHRLLKTMSLLDKKPMSKIIREWIRKSAQRKNIPSDISALGQYLLSMPIEGPEDEFDKKCMKEMEKARKEPDAGKLEDLQKELGLDKHAS
ncbi:MAG: hypothetical protein HQM10_19590 [Candidatus Riflebacteria bacterium]|nr:hypothetical protein [Candidatus Riflebacteria bacterium]